MKALILLLTVTFTLSFENAFAAITVKSTKGQEMNVEVLAYTVSSGNVRIKRLPDGTIFNVTLGAFDKESQKKIKETAPKPKPKLDIKVSSSARRSDIGSSAYMERQKISATLDVKNISRDIDLETTKFTILIIGRDTYRFAHRDRDGCKILSNQNVTQAIPAGESLKFACQPVTTEYDDDKDDSNTGGWDYDGYLLIMQDKDGNVFDAKCSIGTAKGILDSPTALKKAVSYKVGMRLPRTLLPGGR